MKTLIFIGGPTASGKSTLAKSLQDSIPNSIKYRRHQGFFDIASKNNISTNEIYRQVTSEQVDEWFINICESSEVVISDVHYAIQMNRNGIDVNDNIDIHQNYVSTISPNLLNKITSRNIRIIAFYIDCSSSERMTRAMNRYNISKKDFRNISIEDATIENYAEEREWNNLISSGLVEGIKLNSEEYTTEELTKQCLNYLKREEEKILKKTIDN